MDLHYEDMGELECQQKIDVDIRSEYIKVYFTKMYACMQKEWFFNFDVTWIIFYEGSDIPTQWLVIDVIFL